VIDNMRNDKDAIDHFGQGNFDVAALLPDCFGGAGVSESMGGVHDAVTQQTAVLQSSLMSVREGRSVRFAGGEVGLLPTTSSQTMPVDPYYSPSLPFTRDSLNTVAQIESFSEHLLEDIENNFGPDLAGALQGAIECDSIVDSRVALGKVGQELIVATHPTTELVEITVKVVWGLRAVLITWSRGGVTDAVIVERVKAIFAKMHKVRRMAGHTCRTLGIVKGLNVLLQLHEVKYALGKCPTWFNDMLRISETQVAQMVDARLEARVLSMQTAMRAEMATLQRELAKSQADALKAAKPPRTAEKPPRVNPPGGGPPDPIPKLNADAWDFCNNCPKIINKLGRKVRQRHPGGTAKCPKLAQGPAASGVAAALQIEEAAAAAADAADIE